MGLPVDIIDKENAVDKIGIWIDESKKLRQIVTAYSEFYVTGTRDKDFSQIMKDSDMVTPDGISVLAAAEYLKRSKGKSLLGKILEGLVTGKKILKGELGETVTGVWLFDRLTKEAADKGWRVFLLGGWDNVSSRTAKMLLKRFPKLKISFDMGETRVGTDPITDKRVVQKINDFKTDILFVAYNPIKQEKWIANHKELLRVKVAIGVGGTFNEYLGEFKKAPLWMENSGLKWLWRVWVEPRRLGRILRAVVVFPWLVFMESLN